MSDINVPPFAEWPEDAKYRHWLYIKNQPSIQNLAWEEIHVSGKQNDEFVIVCVEVKSDWKDLVKEYMPDYDWESVEVKAEETVTLFTTQGSFCAVIVDEVSGIEQILYDLPEAGKCKVLLLAEGGCSVYMVVPKSLSVN